MPVLRMLEQVKGDVLSRIGKRTPFEWVQRDDVDAVLKTLTSLDPDHWAEKWGKTGRDYEAKGDQYDREGRNGEAGKAYYKAYAFYRIARFPVPSTPGKMTAYVYSVRNFLKAAKYFDPSLEVIEIPFEGRKVVGYLQIPIGLTRPPVVMHWGGVDAWKEDRQRTSEAIHKVGLATFTIDMPGTGENPLLSSDPKAERTFSAAIDHLQGRSDIDGTRIGVLGGSFGGYWATKLAFVEADRVKAAVNWGGGVHYGFQVEWLRKALTKGASQYLLGPGALLDARTYIVGVRTLEELLKIVPRLSLEDQGLLDQPCAPLLAVNGKKDDQQTVADIYLLLEHGNPKEARVYAEGGHMGRVPGKGGEEVLQMIVDWLKQKLTAN